MIFNKNKFSILPPAIMGICNVTKDSFSDGGKNYKTSNALKSINQMLRDGAQIIDIGAESTRPGSDPISYKDEIKKISPILKKLPKDQFLISIDSSKIETQEFALENGAHIINDVFGGSNDLFHLTKKYKNGLVLNGKNPTILYGYGGFNISIKPSFSVKNAIWLEQGGIYAVANIRGGGEYGKKWHDAGTKMQKQNVFDDFIAAAEFLIEKKYTSSDFLAISGRSNGGLLVGACMTQRPDLMKVALPAVGVLDMLRYHIFTSGAGWAYDYGTSEESKEMFEYLKNYSPVHNVKENVAYPATMVFTGDHDDRVVPAHSFKFAAHLQDKQCGKNPTLIRIETNAGHGAGTPISKRIEEIADVFGFTLYNMGFENLPVELEKQD